jgi:hypothetical protein
MTATKTRHTIPSRRVDVYTLRSLRTSYKSLIKAGEESVRAAWRFGQNIDSHTDNYRLYELAEGMGLSYSTLHRYRRFYFAYQQIDLAIEACRQLETFNIDILYGLRDNRQPVDHGRPVAGRKFRYECRSCHSTAVTRVEIDPETGEPIEAHPADEIEPTPAAAGVPTLKLLQPARVS